MPSDTSFTRNWATEASHSSLRAAKSPKEDTRSQPRARTYAWAMGLSSSPSGTKHTWRSAAVKGFATAAPAGETCLKEAALGSPVAAFNSRTSCQELNASKRLM